MNRLSSTVDHLRSTQVMYIFLCWKKKPKDSSTNNNKQQSGIYYIMVARTSVRVALWLFLCYSLEMVWERIVCSQSKGFCSGEKKKILYTAEGRLVVGSALYSAHLRHSSTLPYALSYIRGVHGWRLNITTISTNATNKEKIIRSTALWKLWLVWGRNELRHSCHQHSPLSWKRVHSRETSNSSLKLFLVPTYNVALLFFLLLFSLIEERNKKHFSPSPISGW